jgi:hypothetical protein
MPEPRLGYVLLTAFSIFAGGCGDSGERNRRPSTEQQPAASVSEDTLAVGGGEPREMVESESGEPSMAERSGLEGRVTIGPQCPVLEEGVPCPDRPYQAEIAVLDENSGRVVATFTSAVDGRFRVELPPGRYVLDPGEPLLVDEPRAEKMTIDVEAGRYTEVTLRFDSGIR